ncbi:MAG: SMP-30/gluconolactonase/LRE family protein [Opitutales bacterium]|nr:SMP-30/gluconolactonase/LRE family protein [Opitutales bacterium]
MKVHKAQVLVESDCELGEGPIYLTGSGSVVWVDILRGRLLRYRMDTEALDVVEVGSSISSVVPRIRGGFAATLESGFFALDDKGGIVSRLGGAIHPQDSGLRFNDGKCDPVGRYWAGTMAKDGDAGKGALYCLDPSGKIEEKVSNVSISNGLAWNPLLGRMYFIDTPERSVVSWQYDLDTGRIQNPFEVIRLDDSHGYPDGMCIDAEGKLWVAEWEGSRVCRWDPASGNCLERIELPVSRVTSCCFGGADLSQLIITTARTGLDDKQLAEQPSAGSVFVANLSVRGFPVDAYPG